MKTKTANSGTITETTRPATEAPTSREFEQFRGSARATRRRSGLDEYDSMLWRMRSHVESSSSGGPLLGVVGATDSTGATTIAANLANRLVDHVDGTVLLVDANFYRPKAERLFGLSKNPGLAEVLAGGMPLCEAVQPTRLAGLSLLSSGRAGMLERLGVQAEAVQGLMNELRETYAAVVFDFSEATEMGPSLLLAQQCDGVVLVARADRTRRTEAERALLRLHQNGVTVIGSILNRRRQFVPQWLHRWTR
jgi:Mrp family chromosome partitioning ATPase